MNEPMQELPDGFAEELIRQLKEAGWVLLPPDRVRELKQIVGSVLDAYL